MIPNRVRRFMADVKSYPKWLKQGRPRNFPVVIREGSVISCRHGYALVRDWHWDTSRMDGAIEISHMADILGAQYGVRRVRELDCCPSCAAT